MHLKCPFISNLVPRKVENEMHIRKVAKSKERKVKNIWKNNYQKICHLLCWYWINKINHRKIDFLLTLNKITYLSKKKNKVKTVLRFLVPLSALPLTLEKQIQWHINPEHCAPAFCVFAHCGQIIIYSNNSPVCI